MPLTWTLLKHENETWTFGENVSHNFNRPSRVNLLNDYIGAGVTCVGSKQVHLI